MWHARILRCARAYLVRRPLVCHVLKRWRFSMGISREIGQAPRVCALAAELNTLNILCIGCKDCDGLCHALIEALVVPGIILKRRLA